MAAQLLYSSISEERPGTRRPIRISAPGGRVCLGIPAAEASARGVGDATGSASSSDVDQHARPVALMQPEPGQWPRTDRRLLVALIIADTAVVCAMLAEVAWRTLFVGHIAALGVLALLANAAGLLACRRHAAAGQSAQLLCCLSAAAAAQFLISAVFLQSAWQAVHCALQPVLAVDAYRARGALVHEWFNLPSRRRPRDAAAAVHG